MSFRRSTLVLLLSTFTLGVAGCGSDDSGGDPGFHPDDTDQDVTRDTAEAGGGDTGIHPDDTDQDVTRDTAEAGGGDTGKSDTTTGDTATGDTGTSDTGVTEASGETGATTWEVKVGGTGFVFTPATLAIKVGDTVHWTWAGSSHSVTSGSGTTCVGDGNFNSGSPAAAGATFSHTFDAAGTFPYFCSVHCFSGMVGTITVTP